MSLPMGMTKVLAVWIMADLVFKKLFKTFCLL